MLHRHYAFDSGEILQHEYHMNDLRTVKISSNQPATLSKLANIPPTYAEQGCTLVY
jgi:hypothetical protein